MAESQRRKLDWSSLPKELLQKIADFTESSVETLRFRSVCKKWRSSTQSPISVYFLYPTFPQLVPTQPSSIFLDSTRPIYLIGSAHYLIQPLDSDVVNASKSWIVSVTELNRRCFQVRYPLTKNSIKDLPNDFPRWINVVDFKVTQIGEGLQLCFPNGSEDVFDFEGFKPYCNYPTKCKVVRCDNEKSPPFGSWSVMVLLLNQGGSLGTLNSDGEWSYIDLGPGIHFDDVISLRRKGYLCGVDRVGRAYEIDGNDCRVIRTWSEPMCKEHTHCYARVGRKFLVLIDGMVFMIVRRESKFEVFSLIEGKHCWIELTDFGDWIVFLTFDGVFVVDPKKIPGCRGNSIVFPKNMFSLHSQEFCEDYKLFEGASKYTEVGVYYIGEDHCRLAASEPGFSDLFWPPPSWLSPEKQDSCGGDSDDEDMDFSSYYGSYSEEDAFLQHIEDAANADNLSPSRNQEYKAQPEIPEDNNDGPVAENCTNEVQEDAAKLDIFEGLELSSDLTPVLRKIWAKHGNISEDHVVSSNGLLKWALESLAKMVVILQSNTGKSLDESEAKYLDTTLVDLQAMQFRLDWLVPSVDRALTLYYNKEEIDAIVELEAKQSKLFVELNETEGRLVDQKKLVDEIEGKKSKLLAEIDETEGRIVEQKKLVDASLLDSVPSVLENSLGEGL